MEQKRKGYFDILRIVATFMIMYNHTSTLGFSLYTVTTSGILYWIYLFVAIMVKVAVPIFLMISGALLLHKEETISDVIKKRFSRFFTALVLGTLVHYFYFSKMQISALSLSGFFKGLFAGNVVTPYWYLYHYLAYILSLPLLRNLVKNSTTKQLIYMVAIYFIMQCLSVIEVFAWNGEVTRAPYFSLFIMGNNIFYPILGYLIEHRVEEKYYTKRNVFLAVAIGVLTIVVSCGLTYLQSVKLDSWSEGSTQIFFNTFIFIPASVIFFATRYLDMHWKKSGVMMALLARIGACTFGIYLFETIYRESVKGIFFLLVQYIPAIICSGIWIIIAFLLGLLVTLVMKKLPGLNKVL